MTMNARVELPPAREVCPTTTRRLIAEGALLVDVRELAEVAQVAFDVPGVLLLPLSEFEQRFAELPRDRDLVLVCQDAERSLKATYFLMYQGYSRVANLEGGLLKWARKGYPIKGAQPDPAAGAMTNGCCGAPAPALAATSCCGSKAVAKAESPAGGGCCSPAVGSGGSCC
jgi:rhodanese-related sulfurtransferase